MAEKSPPHSISSLEFWLLWISATTLAAVAALLLADLLVFWQYVHGTTEEIAFGNDNAVGPVVAYAFWIIVLLGPVVGLGQALVLKRFAYFAAWKTWWLASSTLVPTFQAIAIALSLFLAFILKNDEYMIFGFGALLGLAFGLGQLLLVPRGYTKPLGRGTWVVSNVIAGPLGIAGGLLVAGTVGGAYFANATYNFPFYPLQSALYWLLGCVAGSTIYSAISAIALARLLKQPR